MFVGFFIILLNSSWRRRTEPRSFLNIRWKRLSAVDFGAPVNFNVLIGFRNIHFVAQSTQIRRSIKHYVNHGSRPSSVILPYHDIRYYGDDVLNPAKLHLPVIYPTHFTATGYGIRSLTNEELSHCFGIESWNGTVHVPPIPPMQVLHVLIRHLPGGSEGPLPFHTNKWPTSALSSKSSTATWIPSINSFLPHTWMDTTIDNSTAVKSDDAEVPTSLWNSRISLVFPHHSSASLDNLRSLVLMWQIRRIFKEIVLFMTSTFGKSWVTNLLTFRKQITGIVCKAGGMVI